MVGRKRCLNQAAQLFVVLLADYFRVVRDAFLRGDRYGVHLFDGAGEEALDEVALEAEEDDQRDDHQ